jgi:hypothetical protein
MGNNSDRMGNPLAQLGYLPDHLESAIQNEVSGVTMPVKSASKANIFKGNAYMVAFHGARGRPRAVLRSRIVCSHGAACRFSARSIVNDGAERHVHACVGCVPGVLHADLSAFGDGCIHTHIHCCGKSSPNHPVVGLLVYQLELINKPIVGDRIHCVSLGRSINCPECMLWGPRLAAV